SFGNNDILYRFDLIVNNTVDSIDYDKPDGSGSTSLGAGLAALWRYEYASGTWTLLRNEYKNVRHSTVSLGDKLIDFWIQLDSDARLRSFDMDNIHVFMGAVPGHLLREADVTLPPIPYPEVPVLKVHETFDQYEAPFEITDVSQYQGPFTMSQVKRDGTEGALRIVEDTENRFGRGSENLLLHFDSV